MQAALTSWNQISPSWTVTICQTETMLNCLPWSKQDRNKASAVCVCACEPPCTYFAGCPRAGQCVACIFNQRQKERDGQAMTGKQNPSTHRGTCSLSMPGLWSVSGESERFLYVVPHVHKS